MVRLYWRLLLSTYRCRQWTPSSASVDAVPHWNVQGSRVNDSVRADLAISADHFQTGYDAPPLYRRLPAGDQDGADPWRLLRAHPHEHVGVRGLDGDEGNQGVEPREILWVARVEGEPVGVGYGRDEQVGYA